ncbi:glutathione S-transferase family protein [Phenylobacterium aquaticum]|uniref:glutathione S-transferase family protein n=1 Tax=Phenylobacterium aquaticum TaxID=1763816 RepID=UPI001F5C6D45|nr:glutathione S-transferase family protein [Phenylobacterium aquaticum]MCI3134228.1 glutathione S-transferase family protein [Phenylobacterium aquaticum]
MPNLTLFGAPGSGAVAVEAALTLIGEPHDLIDAITWDPDDPQSGDQVLEANPMRQVPALVLPSGEVLTESAAILIWLAEAYPGARLAPPPGAPGRGQFLRWMSFVSASIYSLYWVKDEPSRLAPDRAAQKILVDRTHARIADCWRIMGAQIRPGRYLLGEDLSVLDLYVATVSRFQPRRERFYAVAPSMAAAIRRVDADPRLADLWAARMPSDTG